MTEQRTKQTAGRPDRAGTAALSSNPSGAAGGGPAAPAREAAQTGRQRNYGVDALRILAMLLIVCLHVMNRGGALPYSYDATSVWIYPLRIFASAAVNMYALISGYVTVRGRFRPARIFELWFQVFVLNVVIGLVGCLIEPTAMDDFWIRYLFPFTQKAYWYFTAYVGVWCFSPLINRAVKSLSRKQAACTVWILLGVFSLGATFGYMNQGDPFSIGAGYSVLWLLVLYVVGACLSFHRLLERTSTRRLGLYLALTVALLTGLYCFLHLETLSPEVFQEVNRLLYYTNPFITAVSVLTLLLFARLRPGKRWRRIIAFAAPLTFGVYIVHVHHVIWTPLEYLFRPLLELPGFFLPLAVIGSALGLFLACLFVDWLRSLLFRLLGVKQAAERLEAALRRLADRVF